MLSKISNGLFHLKHIFGVFKNQHKNERDIVKGQETLLYETVRNAFDNVAYYRRVYENIGISPLVLCLLMT